MLPINRCNSAGFRLVLGIALLLIAWQALIPNPVPAAEVVGDKPLHAAAFVLLGFLADAGWPDRPFDRWKFVPLGVYGLAIEFFQIFVPGRMASLDDVIADALGLMAYGVISWVIGRRMATPTEEAD